MIQIVRTDDECPGDERALNQHKIAIARSASEIEEISKCERNNWTWSKLVRNLNKPQFCEELFSETHNCLIAGHHSPHKPALKYWSPVQLGKTQSGQVQVLGVSCAVFDFVGITREDLEELIALQTSFRWLGWFMHPLFEHTAQNPHVRIVMPFAENLEPPKAYAASRLLAYDLSRRVSGVFELVANKSFNPCRMLCWPIMPEGKEYWSVMNYGSVVYVDALLDEYPNWREPDMGIELTSNTV